MTSANICKLMAKSGESGGSFEICTELNNSD